MSKSFINTWNLEFHDEEIEERFRSYNIGFEIRFVKFFLGMLLLFNTIFAAKDYFFYVEERHVVSVYWQALLIVPIYVLLVLMVMRSSQAFLVRHFYQLAWFLFVFTIGSQLLLLHLNGTQGFGINSTMIIVVFGTYLFSGILYRHALFLTPLLMVVVVFFLIYVLDFEVYETGNSILSYVMVLSGLIVIKYQIERQNRLSFNQAEMQSLEDTKIKENYLRVNALSQMRKDLIAILAHDVRSPLASLHGVLQLAKEGDLTEEETMGYIERIETQVSSVNFLINDILIWIKSQSDEADFEKGPFNLSSVIEDLKFLFAEQLEDKGILLQVNLEEDDVYGQPDMIKTILRNFVSNAIKFSSSNDTIYLESKRDGDKVLLSVRDEGVGMSSTELKRLKNTFASKLGTGKEKGMGLGLKICRALIRAHKSTLTIESEPAQGTKISFDLERA
ncbi:hypothetical protein BFP72_17380 [Reichenbachiella sp. 5M10]|uniref:HAMP domain-containing sensor histidine kinase n=1 Tax=Reichenbachiella sp. 5M10 TaxID=1889772 RepID=UPI000C3CBB60|nr:HAMP domain-containing sensor histidine kinase [Reichenbachiella sp. 5M10]PIB37049.1 hypothetical protein BFP72_17380 [Reichenbachiella sp. 5M10]